MSYLRTIGTALLFSLSFNYSADAQVTRLIRDLGKLGEYSEALNSTKGASTLSEAEGAVIGLENIVSKERALSPNSEWRLMKDKGFKFASRDLYMITSRLERIEEYMRTMEATSGAENGRYLAHLLDVSNPKFIPDLFYVDDACYVPKSGLIKIQEQDLEKSRIILGYLSGDLPAKKGELISKPPE